MKLLLHHLGAALDLANLRARRVAGQDLDHGLANAVEIGAELLQDLRCDALALADQPEQDVLGPDVVVPQLQRLAERELEDLLGAGRERDVTGRRRLALADDLLDLLTHGIQGDVEAHERIAGDAVPLAHQAEQDVLGPDVVVVEHPRLFLGEDDGATGSVGEALEHLEPRIGLPPRRGWRSPRL